MNLIIGQFAQILNAIELKIDYSEQTIFNTTCL